MKYQRNPQTNLQIRIIKKKSLRGRKDFQCRYVYQYLNKTPANYTFFPSVGALVSFFTDTSDDLIIDFQWMNGSGTVLSSWHTTIPFDNEDGEDWRNYAEEIEASNTSPDSDATRLEIRIGVGRGDIGIDEDQVWVRYHFDLT